MVWSSTTNGHVSALAGPDYYYPHVAYYAVQGEVRKLLPSDDSVVSVGASQVLTHSRTGVLRARFEAGAKLGELYSAATVQPGKVALSGASPSIFMFDVATNRVSLQVSTKSGSGALKSYRNAVYAGQLDGSVAVLDPRSFRATHSLFSGFTAGVQAIDVKDKLLCCSGYSIGRGGAPFLDGAVRVFDLRMMRPMAPVDFAPGAFCLKFHPVFSGTMILMAQTGQLQVCDTIGSLESLQGYHVDAGGAMLSSLTVSSSGETMFVSDESGFIHQWADRPNAHQNLFAQPLEESTIVKQSSVSVLPGDESVALSMLDTGVWPRKYAPRTLLSTWPDDLFFANTDSMAPIPDLYMQNMKPPREGDFIMYSRLGRQAGFQRYETSSQEPVRYMAGSVVEKAGLRNHLEAFNSPMKSPGPNTPKSGIGGGRGRSDSNLPGSPGGAMVAKPPGLYQQKTISYTKLGVSGFDFEFYNRTVFSGLENTLRDSYINGALQMLFYIPHVRAALSSHLCSREFCLSCELGLLFKMLDQSAGGVCQASNLVRTLNHMSKAKTLGLVGLDDKAFDTKKKAIAVVERFLRFCIAKIKEECKADGSEDPFHSLLSMGHTVTFACTRCGQTATRKEKLSDPITLIYPEDSSTQLTFGSLLRNSLQGFSHQLLQSPEANRDEWCDRCGNKQPSKAADAVVSPEDLPPLLMIFSNLGQSDNCAMWKSSSSSTDVSKAKTGAGNGAFEEGGEGFVSSSDFAGLSQWLPASVRIGADASGVQVEEIASNAADTESGVVYKVTSILAHVYDPRKFPGPGHTVLHQKMQPAHTSEKSLLNQFYMLNDFQVVRTSVREALNVDGNYKNACVLILTKVDSTQPPAPLIAKPVAWPVFMQPSLPRKDGQKVAPQHELQAIESEDDLPQPGEFLPIDAEFVCMEPAVNKVSPSGATTLVRPMHLVLARVSVLRQDGRVLIDDYIQVKDQVHDYLTRFSGIQEGDLDPNQSRHPVTNLKSCYLKLLWLVERGCVFVGHGLSKDFRILNMRVPDEQVRDTVNLFHLPKSRKISLRFLASHLLDLEIQGITHDSIEDAESAMAVFQKYQAMAAGGEEEFRKQLQTLYETGRQMGWQSKRELQELELELAKTTFD